MHLLGTNANIMASATKTGRIQFYSQEYGALFVNL